jgi:hypothetical protein
MRSRWVALIALVVINPARADPPREVQIGSINYHEEINGVSVTIPVQTSLSLDGVSTINVRVIADLKDLQTNIGAIVQRFTLPKDNCVHFQSHNPVVNLQGRDLGFKDDIAVLIIGGSVTDWLCTENPIPNTRVEWEIQTLAPGIKTKVPVIKTFPGNPIKTIIATQSFEATIPIALNLANNAVSLQLNPPHIEAQGPYATTNGGILTVAGVDVSKQVEAALGRTVELPDMMARLSKFSPEITGAHFVGDNGHLMVKIDALVHSSSQTIDDLKAELTSHQN